MATTVLGGHLVPEWQREEGWKAAPSDRMVRGRVAFWPKDHQALTEALALGRLATVEQVSDLNRLFAPDPAVAVRMAAYLEEHGLSVDPPRSGGLYLDFAGTARQVTGVFRCTFAERALDGRMVRINWEDPEVPRWAARHVVAILGLETRSMAHPMHRYPSRDATPANGGQGFFPRDVATAYGFPPGWTGAGETIALLEFSNGFAVSDLQQFWTQHEVLVRSVAFVSVDGTPNDGGIHAVDMECTLDVEWAGAMAPDAALVVYEATAGTSDAGFALSMLKSLDAVATDGQHRPTVVSISYGAAEDRFAASALNAWNVAAMRLAARGITVLAASGDAGAYGIRGPGRLVPHVDVPAAVPHLLAVGGTTLTLTPTDQRQSETGWTDTNNNGASGGGVSQVFPLPAWQDAARVPANPAGGTGRGVPDVALVADPDTGYSVVFQAQPTVVGGTSASSPVWAALIARLNQQRVQQGLPRLGFANPSLYALGGSTVFHPILEGNNSMPGVVGYQCGPGWNAVTGWGSPDGAALASRLG